jgi:hypothetical protein
MVAKSKPVEITVEESHDGRVVIARYANGDVVREPVTKKKPTRKPRLRRQKLMNRTRQKQF